MKVKLYIITALFIVSPLIIFSAEYYITKTGLNVRTGPGKKYKVSYTLEKGDEVKLLNKKNQWYEIEYLGNTGYVNSVYLEFSGNKSETEWGELLFDFMHYILTIVLISLLLYYSFIYYLKIRDKKLLESVTHAGRGTPSERDLVLLLLKNGISPQKIFHDLLIKKPENRFSQADVVVLTDVGIIVFEVKDYSGLIYGRGNDYNWTKLVGRQKYHFQNPIKQNNVHIEELKKHIYQFDDIPFYSVIVFYGDCNLKNIKFISDDKNAFIVKSHRVPDLIRDIINKNIPYSYANEQEVIKVLNTAVTNGGIIENQKQHVQNVSDMLGTDRIYD